MASFSPAPSPEQPYLVIDGSSASVFAGVLAGGAGWEAASSLEGPPLEQLFPAVSAVLSEAGRELSEIRGILYCAGPGSTLGLRLCSMAIATWQRVIEAEVRLFAYNSLRYSASLLRADIDPGEESLLVSDWKKDAWHALRFSRSSIGDPQVFTSAEVDTWPGPLYHLPQRKGWQKPPERAASVTYRPVDLPRMIGESELFRFTHTVELVSLGAPGFQKWKAERHRA